MDGTKQPGEPGLWESARGLSAPGEAANRLRIENELSECSALSEPATGGPSSPERKPPRVHWPDPQQHSDRDQNGGRDGRDGHPDQQPRGFIAQLDLVGAGSERYPPQHMVDEVDRR